MKNKLPVVLNLSVVSAMVVTGFNIVAPVLPQYALTFSV